MRLEAIAIPLVGLLSPLRGPFHGPLPNKHCSTKPWKCNTPSCDAASLPSGSQPFEQERWRKGSKTVATPVFQGPPQWAPPTTVRVARGRNDASRRSVQVPPLDDQLPWRNGVATWASLGRLTDRRCATPFWIKPVGESRLYLSLPFAGVDRCWYMLQEPDKVIP